MKKDRRRGGEVGEGEEGEGEEGEGEEGEGEDTVPELQVHHELLQLQQDQQAPSRECSIQMSHIHMFS